MKNIQNIAEEQFNKGNIDVANLIAGAPEFLETLELALLRLTSPLVKKEGLTPEEVGNLALHIWRGINGDEESAYFAKLEAEGK